MGGLKLVFHFKNVILLSEVVQIIYILYIYFIFIKYRIHLLTNITCKILKCVSKQIYSTVTQLFGIALECVQETL